jgi:hypothetical protein
MLKPHAFCHAPDTLEPSHWSRQPCLPLIFQPEASNSCTSPNPWGLWECTNSRVLDKVSGPLTGLVTDVSHADPVGDARRFWPPTRCARLLLLHVELRHHHSCLPRLSSASVVYTEYAYGTFLLHYSASSRTYASFPQRSAFNSR